MLSGDSLEGRRKELAPRKNSFVAGLNGLAQPIKLKGSEAQARHPWSTNFQFVGFMAYGFLGALQPVVVMDPPLTLPVRCRRRTVMGFRLRLLGLVGMAADERHAALTHDELRNLERHRHSVDQDLLQAPIKLKGLSGVKRQRNWRVGKAGTAVTLPVRHMPPNRLTAKIAKMLPDLLRVQPITAPAPAVCLKKCPEFVGRASKLRRGPGLPWSTQQFAHHQMQE